MASKRKTFLVGVGQPGAGTYIKARTLDEAEAQYRREVLTPHMVSRQTLRDLAAAQSVDIGIKVPGERLAELVLEVVLEAMRGQSASQKEKMWDWYIADSEKVRAWIERLFRPPAS